MTVRRRGAAQDQHGERAQQPADPRRSAPEMPQQEPHPLSSLLGNRATAALLQRQGALPLQPNLLRLQRTIGNRATGQLLRKPATPLQSTAIQRISWQATVDGERIVDVVRLSPNKPVWKIEYDDGSSIVIKFETITGRRGTNPMAQTTALQELGRMEGVRDLFTAGMKERNLIGGRHCEPSEIVDALKAFHKNNPNTPGSRELISTAAQTDEEMFVNDYVTGIEDMSKDDGDNGRTRNDGTPDYVSYSQAKEQTLKDLIFNETNLTDLGRMIYIDTLMGSQDRLGRVHMNLENITFKDDGNANGKVLALDNFDPNATLDNLVQQGGGRQKTNEQKMLETIYRSKRHAYAIAMLAKFYEVTGYVKVNADIAAQHGKDAGYILSGMDKAETALLSKLKGLIKQSQRQDRSTPGSYFGEKATYLTEISRRAKEAKKG